MTLRITLGRLVLIAILACVLPGCWGSAYDRIEGLWQGDLKGQRIVAEFRPSENFVILDGRSGAMRVTSEHGAIIALEMIGPDGRTGNAVISILDENHIRLEIPDTGYAVDFGKVE